MTTILMFAGSTQSPKGGVKDLYGTMPLISPPVVLGSVLEFEAKKGNPLDAEYWAEVLITSNGQVREHRGWKILVGAHSVPDLEEACRTAQGVEPAAVMYIVP